MTKLRPGSQMFYDTVIFDAAGTLVGRDSPDFFEEFFVVAAGELGAVITLDQVKAALSKAMEEPRFRKRDGRMSTPDQTRRYFLELYAQVFDTAGIKGDLLPGLQQYYDRFQDGRYLNVYSDVRPTLERLRRCGVRLGVLSNWSEHLALVLRRHDLDRYFSFLVVSAEAGCEKPDEKIFRLAIQRAETPIDRILYIGDYPEEDILPAERVGLDALLIDRYDKYGRYRLPSIRQMTDVPGLIGLS